MTGSGGAATMRDGQGVLAAPKTATRSAFVQASCPAKPPALGGAVIFSGEAPMVQAKVDDKPTRDAIRALAESRYPKAIPDALNKTAFEVLDAWKAHVASIFDFAGNTTKRWLSGRGSFRFKKATRAKQSVEMRPSRSAGAILDDHIDGGFLDKGDERLTFDGMLAVPINVRRGTRGRVGKKRTPSAITGKGGRGFRKGDVILERPTKRSKKVRAAYALVDQATAPPVFRFYETAEEAIRKVFITKARQVLSKIPLRRGGRR